MGRRGTGILSLVFYIFPSCHSSSQSRIAIVRLNEIFLHEVAKCAHPDWMQINYSRSFTIHAIYTNVMDSRFRISNSLTTVILLTSHPHSAALSSRQDQSWRVLVSLPTVYMLECVNGLWHSRIFDLIWSSVIRDHWSPYLILSDLSDPIWFSYLIGILLSW
jgi:hypothetical protein